MAKRKVTRRKARKTKKKFDKKIGWVVGVIALIAIAGVTAMFFSDGITGQGFFSTWGSRSQTITPVETIQTVSTVIDPENGIPGPSIAGIGLNNGDHIEPSEIRFIEYYTFENGMWNIWRKQI